MYHYTLCGLRNIWLMNGYEEYDTPDGKAVSITDADGLDLAIAKTLVLDKQKLTGAEFRFLRKQLDMSQKSLGELMGVQALAIHRWETGKPTKMADHFIRTLYAGQVLKNKAITEVIERLNERDQKRHSELKFKSNPEWAPEIAA